MAEPYEVGVFPNWARPVSVSYEFKTNIFESGGGYETRSAAREFPRRTISFEVLGGGRRNPAPRTISPRVLSRDVKVPDVTMPRRAVFSAATTLEGPFNDHRFSSGKEVFVKSSLGTYLRTILSCDGESLVLSEVVPTVSGQSVVVHPALLARQNDLSVTFRTNTVAQVSSNFTVYADQDPVKDAQDVGLPVFYRGSPLFVPRVNWRDEVSEEWSQNYLEFDPGWGTPFRQTRRADPQRAATFTMTLFNMGQIRSLLDFFCYCRGRQGSFYAPTGVGDLELREPPLEGSDILSIEGLDASLLFEGATVFRNLLLTNGEMSWAVPVIDAYTVGPNSELVLAQPVPAGFGLGSRASWLVRQRFRSDSLEVSFRTSEVAEVEISLVSLPEEQPVVSLIGLELTVGGLFVTLGEIEADSQAVLTAVGNSVLTVQGDFVA